MKKLANDKGITMVALVVTIIILLILASISIVAGRDVIANAKLTAFGVEMEIMQQEVNKLQQRYKNGDTSVLELGLNLQGNEIETKAFNGADIDTDNREGYRYYNKATIEELGLKDFSQEFLVNIPKRMIISLAGFKYRGEEIWTMAQLSSGAYNVNYNGIESETTFDLSVDDSALIISNIQYSGNVKKCSIYYGQGESANSVDWKVAKQNTEETSCKIDVQNEGTWYVKIVDSAGNESEVQHADLEFLNYAKNGLILHLDAINNTGKGHSNTATIWKDLSGNENDAIFYNLNNTITSGWQDNKIVLDGIDDYAEILNNNALEPIEQTIEIVLNRTGSAPSCTDRGGRGIIFVLWPGYTFETNNINNNNKYNISYGRNNGYLVSNTLLSLNNTYKITGTHENNKSKLYINNNIENEQQVTPTAYVHNNLLIGKYNSATYTKCEIYSIRMYNRALTENELNHNYIIDKNRFGIEE